MIQQYVYSAKEAGLNAWPSGELRLEGIPITADPSSARLFVCPGPLLLFQKPTDLDRFPYIHGREEQHVFFDCSDWDTLYTRKNCIFIRCNLKRFMLEAHPNSVAWPWPVADFGDSTMVSGFRFDLSFQGWLSSEWRIQAATACAETSGLKCDIATYSDFFGYLKDGSEEQARRKAEFRRSMQESRIALCPQSIDGCLPYRLYEALSAARIPLLVGSNYTLPFEDEIPYSDFIIRCPAKHADKAGEIALEFIRAHTDEQIIEKGIQARYYWTKYLHGDWPKTMSYAIQKKLGVLQAA